MYSLFVAQAEKVKFCLDETSHTVEQFNIGTKIVEKLTEKNNSSNITIAFGDTLDEAQENLAIAIGDHIRYMGGNKVPVEDFVITGVCEQVKDGRISLPLSRSMGTFPAK